MAISYPAILDLKDQQRRFTYTGRETMLYALGIGMGSDPLDETELPFVYEKDLRAVPTLATVVAWESGVTPEQMGINYKMMLHGEEETILHRPMPVAASIVVESDILDVYDKGEGRGAVIVRRTILRDAADGELIATIHRTGFARADGGAGGSPNPAPAPHQVPDRSPDASLQISTRPDQATLYRLSGDRNPLHIDPAAARSAGFDAPILHGLCTYGITCRAVLRQFCDFDPARIASHAVRFSSPVYPGDTLQVDMWRDGDVVSFQASVPARDVTVIKNGKTTLRPGCSSGNEDFG